MVSEHEDVRHIVLPNGDELIVDEASGEVIEWPTWVTDRLALLQQEHAQAASMQKAWELRRQTLSRAIGPELDHLNTRAFVSATHRTKWTSPKAALHCYKPTLTMALAMHFITLEQLDEMLERASRELTEIPIVVLDEMVQAKTLTQEQRDALVTEIPRAGYARTTELLAEEPGEARKRRKKFDDGQV